MAQETLHMSIGSGLGEILLDIAQTHITKGDPEKAITTYTDSLQGFTKEYALMCLKNEAVLVVDEENQVMELKDDPELIAENAHLVYDWNLILTNKKKTLNDIRDKRLHIMDEFNKLYSGRIEDYSIIEMMKRYYTDEALQQIGIHNIAARIIGAIDSKILDHGSDNPQSKWDRLCAQMEYEDNPDVPNCNKVLYWTVEYVKTIKLLHKEFMEFDKMYHFLVDNGLANRLPFIEYTAEHICDILNRFADTSTGYYHPLCNTGLYEYKEEHLSTDLIHTIWGKEFCQYGIIKKNIMDGYDAGWLSPEGDFYGGNGPTSAMIHLNIANQIFNASCNPIAVKMMKDGISEFGGVDSPDYWLEQHGWIKIHHEDCYGSFIGRRDEEPTKEYPYAYNPTDIQVKMVCDYADKFYGGKFYTEANVMGRMSQTEPFKTYAVRQMDEFGIHKVFGR